jgi:hypothetical protein
MSRVLLLIDVQKIDADPVGIYRLTAANNLRHGQICDLGL